MLLFHFFKIYHNINYYLLFIRTLPAQVKAGTAIKASSFFPLSHFVLCPVHCTGTDSLSSLLSRPLHSTGQKQHPLWIMHIIRVSSLTTVLIGISNLILLFSLQSFNCHVCIGDLSPTWLSSSCISKPHTEVTQISSSLCSHLTNLLWKDFQYFID